MVCSSDRETFRSHIRSQYLAEFEIYTLDTKKIEKLVQDSDKLQLYLNLLQIRPYRSTRCIWGHTILMFTIFLSHIITHIKGFFMQ